MNVEGPARSTDGHGEVISPQVVPRSVSLSMGGWSCLATPVIALGEAGHFDSPAIAAFLGGCAVGIGAAWLVFSRLGGSSSRAAGDRAMLRTEEEIRATQAALKAERDNLRAIMESSPVALLMLDDEQTLIDVNLAAERLFGHARGDLKRQRCGDLLGCVNRHGSPEGCGHSSNCPACLLMSAIRESQATGKSILDREAEATLERDGGKSSMWFRFSVQPAVLDGKPRSIVALLDITASKEAEVALREREENLRYILRYDPNCIAVFDREMRYLAVSNRFLKDYNVNWEDILGQRHYDVFPDMPDRWKEVHQRALSGEVVANDDDSFVRTDGSITYNRWECRPWYHADGEIGGIILYSEVTTERKLAEIALRESEQFARATLNSLDSHLCVLNEEGRIIAVNRAWEEFAEANGGHLDQLGVGANYLEICDRACGMDAPDACKAAAGIRRVIAGEVSSFHFEYPCHGPGAKRWFNMRVTKFAGGGGARAILAHADITARVLAKEALRESETRYRQLAETGRDAIILHRMDGRIVYVNKAGMELTGRDEAYFVDRNIGELVTEQCREEMNARKERRQQGDRTRLLYEVEILHADGCSIPVEVSSAWVETEDGESALLIVARDITERRGLENQLRQAQKMESVGRLAGGVAHDFNNMLQTILGYTDLSLDAVGEDGEVRGYLEEIQAAGQRSAALTRQLLAFARKQTISPRILDLNQVVAGILKMLRRLIGEDIELRWKPHHDLWPVKMDPSQIDQILANLSVNARDAIHSEGWLTIETDNVTIDGGYAESRVDCAPGDYVLLAVSDNGVGMEKEVQEHLFEPFFTTKEQGKGTGLGLAMVYGAVKQNQGFINVYSEPNIGTSIKIYLPREGDAEAELQPKTVDHPPARGTETVLIAEDDESILHLGKAILESYGYTVLAARRPQDALRIAGRHEGAIHLLITDVVMPEMNGRELRDILALGRPDIKVLFMSGYTANVIAHHGVIDEGIEFLQKPFSVRMLTDKVRAVLDEG